MGCWSLPAGAPPPPGGPSSEVHHTSGVLPRCSIFRHCAHHSGTWSGCFQVGSSRLNYHNSCGPFLSLWTVPLIGRVWQSLVIIASSYLSGSRWEVIETSASVFIGFFKRSNSATNLSPVLLKSEPLYTVKKGSRVSRLQPGCH